MKTAILILLMSVAIMAGEFTIDSVDIEFTYITKRLDQQNDNFGAISSGHIGDNFVALDRDCKILFRVPDLNDSMQNHSGVTWDSAIVWFVLFAEYLNADDSLIIEAHELLVTDWVEGLGAVGQTESCGVSWDSANATDYTGCSGSSTEWPGSEGASTEGTDYSATKIQWLVGGSYLDSLLILYDTYSQYDTIKCKLTGAMVSDTINNAGIILIPTYMADDDADNAIYVTFYSENQPGYEERWPSATFYYTEGGATAAKYLPIGRQ